jgi:hypothetical protein
MFAEDSLAVGILFAEGDCVVTGPTSGEGESSNAGKKVKVGWSVMVGHGESRGAQVRVLHSLTITIK